MLGEFFGRQLLLPGLQASPVRVRVDYGPTVRWYRSQNAIACDVTLAIYQRIPGQSAAPRRGPRQSGRPAGKREMADWH